MAEQFNPYYTWLGIPLADQPPNHYRLLGLALYEADPQVIHHAADRHVTYVRTFNGGAQAAIAQKILDELESARDCLLEDAARAAYDKQLRAALAKKPPPAPRAPWKQKPPEALPRIVANDELDLAAAANLEADPEYVPRRVVRRAPATGPPLALLAGLFVVALVLVIAVIIHYSGSEEVPQAATPANNPVGKPALVGATIPEPAATTQPHTTPTPTAATPTNSVPPSNAGVAKRDLLKELASSGQPLAPGWHWDGTTLVSEASDDPQLQPLPGAVPPEYDLEMVVERAAGNYPADGCLAVSLPSGESSVDVIVDLEGYRTAVGRFAGANGNSHKLALAVGPLLRMGQANRHVLSVGIDHVAFDRVAAFPMRGDVGLSKLPPKRPRPPHQLALGATQPFRISLLVLRSGNGTQPAAVRAGSLVGKPQAEQENLLQLIDPAKDAICGNWRFEGTDLVSTGYPLEMRAIEIPLQPAEPYRVTLKCECEPLDSALVVLGLIRNPQKGRDLFTATVDVSGASTGFWQSNSPERPKPPPDADGKSLTIVCTVRYREIRLECNGQVLAVWDETRKQKDGKYPRPPSLDPHTIRERFDRLFLNCRGARFTIHEFSFEHLKL